MSEKEGCHELSGEHKQDFGIVTDTEGESASQRKVARETVCKRGYGRGAIATIIILSDGVRE